MEKDKERSHSLASHRMVAVVGALKGEKSTFVV